MTLIKTSLLSFFATAIKMLAGLVISKAVAVFVGPTGLALVGQFQNLIQVLMTAAKGAIDTGVTKYTAEYRDDSVRLFKLFSTALVISLVASVLVSTLLISASSRLSSYFLQSEAYGYVMVIFGFTVALFVLNSLLLAILNGLHEIRTYIVINVIQSSVHLALTALLIAKWKLDGALIALVTNQSVVLAIVLWMLKRHPVIRPRSFLGGFDIAMAKRLGSFAAMTVASAVAAPVSTMLVRDHITRTMGLAEAGYWQGAWYVSTIYLTVVTTSLGLYYLPKLSATKDRLELHKELKAGYITIMPIVTLMALAVYTCRGPLVTLVFTKEFDPMLPLFKWLLIGDVIKLASWLLSYLMLAKAMSREFIATEITFSTTFVVLCMALTPAYGLEGVMYAHALNYGLYLVAVAVITRRFWR